MLVLTRKKHESIKYYIPPGYKGGIIEVHVADVRCGDRVRLATTADKEIRIVRTEIETQTQESPADGPEEASPS